MKDKYFPEREITHNDLFFVCFMVEKVARTLHRHNRYVVEHISDDRLWHYLSIADVLHSQNPDQTAHDWITDERLSEGSFDITDIDKNIDVNIPSATAMGKVYTRLIIDTMLPDEDYVHAIRRIYGSSICDKIDDYNCSAFYEPSYIIARAYHNGGF